MKILDEVCNIEDWIEEIRTAEQLWEKDENDTSKWVERYFPAFVWAKSMDGGRYLSGDFEEHIKSGLVIRKTVRSKWLFLKKKWRKYYVKSQVKKSDRLCVLGHQYENGNGVKQSYHRALYYYKRAAACGNAYGFNGVGWLYVNGNGVEQDFERAMKYFMKAALRGCTTAMVNIGNIYESAIYGYEDSDAALSYWWYRLAAEQSDLTGIFNLANCYHYGNGVPQNYNIAFSLFGYLKQKKYYHVLFYMGLYYENGWGVQQDFERAVFYYEKGIADENDAYCYLQLGCMYGNGKGVDKNLKKAFMYYKKAGELGDSLGYSNLASMYENGDYVKKNMKKAIEYYKMASGDGEEYAVEALKRLGIRL